MHGTNPPAASGPAERRRRQEARRGMRNEMVVARLGTVLFATCSLAVAAGGCGDASGLSAMTCAELSEAALARVEAVAERHLACEGIEGECGRFGKPDDGPMCWSSCNVVSGSDSLGPILSAMHDSLEIECAEYSRRCGVFVQPECDDDLLVRCVSEVCVLTER